MMVDIGKKYNKISIQDGKERGGYIYSNAGKLFQSDVEVSKSDHHVRVNHLGSRNILANWHTHGDSKYDTSLVFSDADIKVANKLDAVQKNYHGAYLFTGKDHMKFYEGGAFSTEDLNAVKDKALYGVLNILTKDLGKL